MANANAVIGDVEIHNIATDELEFLELVGVDHIQALGFKPFRIFTPGDYLAAEAILAIEVTPFVPTNNYLITHGKLTVDVPDIIESGIANINVGWTQINFTRPFQIVAPDVLPLVRTSLSQADAEVRNVTKTGFESRILRRSDNAEIDGTITWTARGY